MKGLWGLLAVCVLCGAIAVAYAQEPGAGGAKAGGTTGMAKAGGESRGLDALLAKADANKDGKISKEEWTKYQDDQFAQADTNKDGNLDQDELKAMMTKMRGGERKAGEAAKGGKGGKKGKGGGGAGAGAGGQGEE